MYIYMAVTSDKYELPIAVADTIKELAVMLDKSPNSLSSARSKQSKGVINKYKIVKVEIDDDD